MFQISNTITKHNSKCLLTLKANRWQQKQCEIQLLFQENECSPLPRPYFTSFFRFTVVISLSGDGKAMTFFLSESVQHKDTFDIATVIYG